MSQTPEQIAREAAESARLENNSARILAIQERIVRARELEARYAQDTSAQGQIAYRRAQELLVNLERRRKHEQATLVDQKTLNKELATFAKSYAKLSSTVKAQLQTQSSINGQTSIYKSLGEEIAKSKAREANLSGEALEAEMERGSFMNEINSSLLDQAKSTAKAKEDLLQLTEFEKMRNELKETTLKLSDDERKKLEDAIDLQEQLYLKEQRYNELKQGGADILGKLPAGMQSVIGGIKNMITGIRAFGVQAAMATAGLTLAVGAIIAGLDYFMGLEQAAEDFRKETGVTNSMMGEMSTTAENVGSQFANYGVSIEQAFDTMAALRSEMGEVAKYSDAAVAGLSLMTTNFGVSAEEAAQVQSVLENVGGLSQDTAVSVQMQVAEMSKLAGVAPKQVLKDIAENAEATSTFFKGDIELLAKQAVQARRLGTNLKDVTATAEKLLDFESGIEEELVAATFVGGQFNLSRARGLAFEGKIVEAQEETLKQIQRSGDFRKKDYFTQQQLAKAAGMSVEEINKQLNTQEKLSKLTAEEKAKAEEAINAGLDITNINDEQLMQEVEKAAAQKEMASTITDMENTFKGILATVGGALMPLFNILGPVLKVAFFPLKIAAKLLEFIIDSITWVIKKIPGIGTAFEKVSSFFGEADSAVTNFSLAKLESGAYSDGGEMTADASIDDGIVQNGKVITTNPKDTLIATQNPSELLPEQQGLQALSNAFGLDKISSLFGTAGSLLTPDSAKFDQLIAEIKGLRSDLAAGKVAVYMDTEKVTSKIGRQVDQSSRNNYSLGQA
jgi:transcriptional regulator with XRE-family HTH domain